MEITRNKEQAERVIREAADPDVIRYLLNELDDKFGDDPVDILHDEERGIGSIREAILRSGLISHDLKRDIVTRDDDPRDLTVAVPNSIWKNALGALAVGKPVVLYGPTGTGKTTLAKQLAMDTAVGYNIETAAPSWTDQDIIGRIAPDHSNDTVEYVKEPGCVSSAVLKAQSFDENWGLIIDELTRADISRIFGPLYTAIENRSQTLFETEDNTITLDPRVKIICTMNVSDRTVNELDDAITRRFAMIKVGGYDKDERDILFRKWVGNTIDCPTIDTSRLVDLFHADYEGLNYGQDTGEGIHEFGPMHYRDVVDFLGTVTTTDRDSSSEPGVGVYSDQPARAVGEAFKIYILPRLLNDATFPQIEQLPNHYQRLQEVFEVFDLAPAIDLAEQRYQSEEQRLSGR
ncbi:AAA family ATPase [Halocatena pleomorpha]|nr:AAA family ATPase [Halocatena pleomorpha]